MEHIESTVRRIRDNGNRVTFNLYSEYHTDTPLQHSQERRLLDEVLRVAGAYPDAVVAHPYYLRALVTGGTEFGRSVTTSVRASAGTTPVSAARRASANPTLPLFNVYGADLQDRPILLHLGALRGLPGSQAVQSWLLVSVRRFLDSEEGLRTWVDLAESYWRHFVWSPYHALSAEPSLIGGPQTRKPMLLDRAGSSDPAPPPHQHHSPGNSVGLTTTA